MTALSLDTAFLVPGDPGFPLGQAFEAPKDRAQQDMLRAYIGQMRQEIATRLAERLWAESEERPSKWWMSFVKRKFMGRAL
jgi:actin related protein 2/3 complex subunit 3